VPKGRVIQPAHILAVSLLALGASTLHGVRFSAPPGAAPGLRPVSQAALAARDRVARAACVRPVARGRDGAGCAA
jgi:hypothetical protein